MAYLPSDGALARAARRGGVALVDPGSHDRRPPGLRLPSFCRSSDLWTLLPAQRRLLLVRQVRAREQTRVAAEGPGQGRASEQGQSRGDGDRPGEAAVVVAPQRSVTAAAWRRVRLPRTTPGACWRQATSRPLRPGPTTASRNLGKSPRLSVASSGLGRRRQGSASPHRCEAAETAMAPHGPRVVDFQSSGVAMSRAAT